MAALLESGTEDNFFDSNLVNQLGIPTEPLDVPLEAHALNGLKLTRVLLKTVPITMIIAGNHQEEIFFLMEYPCAPIVLGYPWLL